MTYESEAVLEKSLIDYLSKNGYEKVSISSDKDLEENFRKQVCKFNEDKLKGKPLTDKEFQILMNRIEGKSIFESSKILRDKIEIQREDGSTLYLSLMDTKKWCKNLYQVSSQIQDKGTRLTRYDVTILINGLPLAQIELKRRGLDMKEAFNQIVRYKHKAYTGLFKFIQIFIISNGVDTKYFANSDGKLNYKFTFFWTDKENNRITNLKDFARTFLDKCHLSKMIARYMVLKEGEKQLLVLRPYQVYAVEEIVKRALETNNNGYIWHTTGSGKTLTSFKASQILAGEKGIDKVFFLVDRQDLDSQTEKEFNEFQPGSVDRTDSTRHLVEQIKNILNPIIITTIQKMTNAVNNPKYADIMDQYRDKKVIFIIDECHRSQFGKMHTAIKKHFQNSQYFGFTGTPRFKANRSQDDRTTADLFDKCLHHYLIKDAIHDGNVLGFSVSYVKTMDADLEKIAAERVKAIDVDEILKADERIENIVQHIIDHHDQRAKSKGYNALFATDSVDSLRLYYDKFKELDHDLTIASIFSYQDNQDMENRDKSSRDILEYMIEDYNKTFNSNFSTEKYQSYRADLDKKFREGKIDILLVVDMFLTGFDSKKLNTLYLDKNLNYHNLIQAYSRTNRIDSEKKPYGNIISFRDLKAETDEALKLFSKTDNVDELLAKTYKEYLDIFKEQLDQVKTLAPSPDSIDSMYSEEDQKDFVLAFRELSKTLIRLENFEEFNFSKEELGIDSQEYQDYRSKYFLIRENNIKNRDEDKVSVLDDIDFALEIMHRDRINVDYIMDLVGKIDLENEERKKEDINYIISQLERADSVELRNKVELIKEFLDKVVPGLGKDDSIEDEFLRFQEYRKDRTIGDFALVNRLPKEQVEELVEEYEFSRVIDSEKISDALVGAKYGLLENQKKSKELEIFIKDIAEEYI